MPRDLAELEREALALSEQDRARLAEQLLSSLVPGEDVAAEEAWLAEAEQRYRAFREGKMAARPAEQVLSDARKRLG